MHGQHIPWGLILKTSRGPCLSQHLRFGQHGQWRQLSDMRVRHQYRGSKQVSRGVFGLLLATGIAAFFAHGHESPFIEAHAEAPEDGKPRFERPPKKIGISKEENRDMISSQHLQVKNSWENPGVYAWGSNAGRVASPDSDELHIKTPRRILFFDGMLLRDLKLDSNLGAAVTERGDLLQWGNGYSTDVVQPTLTLKGKGLTNIVISRDRIIALASDSQVYSLPASRTDQESGPKPMESSWFPFWSSRSKVSYRNLKPKSLPWGEKVCAIDGGLEHVLLLTSRGRVFSAASSSEEFPSRGQLGVPRLTWNTRPAGPYDQCHEITTLRGFEITKVAAGDFHSFALDKDGRVFGFGDNSLGQLGFDYNPEAVSVDAPSLLPIQRLYTGTNQTPRVTDVAAGGVNSFFTVDATRVAAQGESSRQTGLGRVTADTFSCGQGILGGLGNGRWTHVQGTPTKIKALSGLFEYDEKLHKVIPIRLSRLSVGSTHASAVMDNVTHLGANEKSSENDTNWGADVLWWGGNEYYQLGTGKRNNVANPIYIAPLDANADKERGRREEHRFQITPQSTVKRQGRSVTLEQRIECGRRLSAVYSAV